MAQSAAALLCYNARGAISQSASGRHMKYSYFFLAAFFSTLALADPTPPTIPLNQNLAALDYSKAGKQTGCGLRITGETGGDLWINILLSVFSNEAQAPIGMFKVVVKKITMQNSEPLLQDGKIVYSIIGKINQAWIKTASGVQLQPYANGASAHGDGYMTSLGFSNAVDLLIAIPQASFRVGFSKDENAPDEILEFDQRIGKDEADKLTACMKNLRDAMARKEGGESF